VLLTVAEVAERLNVDRHTVWEWTKAGILAHIPLPGTGSRSGPIRVEEAEVDRLIAERRQPARRAS
jgi:excisionase family DNA binding protein